MAEVTPDNLCDTSTRPTLLPPVKDMSHWIQRYSTMAVLIRLNASTSRSAWLQRGTQCQRVPSPIKARVLAAATNRTPRKKNPRIERGYESPF